MSYLNQIGSSLLSTLLLLLSGFTMAAAQTGPNASYTDFANLTDVSNVQIRLAYVGGLQDEIPPPVILTTSGKSPDPATFHSFERPSGVVYPPALVNPLHQDIPTSQMQQLIANVGTINVVVSGSVAAEPWLAFALSNISAGQTKVAEAVLNQADTLSLVQQITSAIASSDKALALVTELACGLGGLPPGQPTDVSNLVSISRTGVRLDRATDDFVSEATLINTSGNTISGPLSLVFTFAGPGVSLSNATGVTCATSPTGLGYINVPLANNALAPNESVKVTLRFASPDRDFVTAAIKILAGAGAR
jgi:hypothetical protein